MYDLERGNFSEEDMLKNLNFDQTLEEEVEINVNHTHNDNSSHISKKSSMGINRNNDTESDLDRKNRLLDNINQNYAKSYDRGLKTSEKYNKF